MLGQRQDGAAAGAGNASLERRNGHIGAGADLVFTVLHEAKLPIGVGLDAQLEGLSYCGEGNGGFSVGELYPGAVAAVAGIAYAVYRFVTPKYLEEFEEEFDEDFEDEFFEDEEL